GHCTDGSVSQACFSDAQCQSELSCAKGSSRGQCTSGAVGEPCEEDADCRDGVCADGSFESLCTQGKIDQPCGDNSECEAGHCVRTYASEGPTSVCTDGSVGTRCDREDDADCTESRCTKDRSG